jgi:ParB-like chromosome segregation protein Spo0J
MKKRIHALAEIFPELDATAFGNLKASIDEHGQRDPIVLLGDEILDGRNRYKACLELGRNPQFRNFDPARDGDPIKFVADKNLNRRHLTPGQRASVAKKIDDFMKEAAELAKAEAAKKPPVKEQKPRPPLGDADPTEPTPEKKDPPKGKDDREFRKREAEAAAKAGASPRALRDFKFVEKYSPKDAKLVTAGKITLNEGVKRAKEAKTKVSKFRNEAADLIAPNMGEDFAEKLRDGEILRKDSEIRTFSRLELKEQRKIKKAILDGLALGTAQKLANDDFDPEDKIATLTAWFEGKDKDELDEAGWASVEVGGFVIAVGRAAKTDAEEA